MTHAMFVGTDVQVKEEEDIESYKPLGLYNKPPFPLPTCAKDATISSHALLLVPPAKTAYLASCVFMCFGGSGCGAALVICLTFLPLVNINEDLMQMCDVKAVSMQKTDSVLFMKKEKHS